MFQYEQTVSRLRTWIQTYQHWWEHTVFQVVLHDQLCTLRQMIMQVLALCAPDTKPLSKKSKKGKKGKKGKKTRTGGHCHRNHQEMGRRIAHILNHLELMNETNVQEATRFAHAFEEALRLAFDALPSAPPPPRPRAPRGTQTIVFPYARSADYSTWIQDRQRVLDEVIAKLGDSIPVSGHAPECQCHTRYTLKGVRRQPRKCLMVGGRQEEFPIRMVKCAECGRTFSLLPSFLAREKHVALEVIGHAVEKMTLFGQSLAATLKDLALVLPGGHSKQTLLDWLTWFGTLHPATILTRAGIQGTGYFQEDEGFEKEAGLRTYTVAMVEPETLLVWHLDYVDHVDEETLCASFADFVQHIDMNVLGVTKDKWQPSTQALRKIFHGIWIAFCHRHELKKWRQALTAYQDVVQCRTAERQRLYQRVKTVLETAESGTVLRLKLKGLELEDPAFRHPLLQARLKVLWDNAVRYTCHHTRHGLTPTTSIVDNFLKGVKRKLQQVESFRDQECTRTLFRAMATVRNFVPFLSGAKHAHHSPFMLAHGETHDLPWVQVMNIHNAFLHIA